MDPLRPFDDAVIEAVAEDRGMTPGDLRKLARRLHEYAAKMPGIDELVMEWRRFRAEDPLVARTDTAYLLAIDQSVWLEFGDQLGVTDIERATLEALHDRQARLLHDDPQCFDDRAALVFAR